MIYTPRHKFISYRENQWYEFCIKYTFGWIRKEINDITNKYEEIEIKPLFYFSCYFFIIEIKLRHQHFSYYYRNFTYEEEINNNRYIILSDILYNKKAKIKPIKISHFIPISYGIRIIKTDTGQKVFVLYFGKKKDYQGQCETYFKIGQIDKSYKINLKTLCSTLIESPTAKSDKKLSYKDYYPKEKIY